MHDHKPQRYGLETHDISLTIRERFRILDLEQTPLPPFVSKLRDWGSRMIEYSEMYQSKEDHFRVENQRWNTPISENSCLIQFLRGGASTSLTMSYVQYYLSDDRHD